MISTLDTHEVVKDLMAAGFTDGQAEAVTRAVKKAQDIDFSSLATKADLKTEIAELRTELRTEIAGVKTEIVNIRSELIKWVVGIAFAQVAMILVVLRPFPGSHP